MHEVLMQPVHIENNICIHHHHLLLSQVLRSSHIYLSHPRASVLLMSALVAGNFQLSDSHCNRKQLTAQRTSPVHMHPAGNIDVLQ